MDPDNFLNDSENFSDPIIQPNSNKINSNLNFDYFKQRNKEINKKGTNKKGGSKLNTINDPENEESKEKEFIDEKTLAKLQELIKDDKENIDKGYKKVNPDIEDTIDENDASNIQSPENEKELLVNRPAKNFVWGLGNQTKQKKCNNQLKTYQSYK